VAWQSNAYQKRKVFLYAVGDGSTYIRRLSHRILQESSQGKQGEKVQVTKSEFMKKLGGGLWIAIKSIFYIFLAIFALFIAFIWRAGRVCTEEQERMKGK
jgi:hypothetical protein